MQTGDYLHLRKRGTSGVPPQGRRLCAVHSPEEGKPAREPPRAGTGGDGRTPGAQNQKRGVKARSESITNPLFSPLFMTLQSTAPRLCQAQRQRLLHLQRHRVL